MYGREAREHSRIDSIKYACGDRITISLACRCSIQPLIVPSTYIHYICVCVCVCVDNAKMYTWRGMSDTTKCAQYLKKTIYYCWTLCAVCAFSFVEVKCATHRQQGGYYYYAMILNFIMSIYELCSCTYGRHTPQVASCDDAHRNRKVAELSLAGRILSCVT